MTEQCADVMFTEWAAPVEQLLIVIWPCTSMIFVNYTIFWGILSIIRIYSLSGTRFICHYGIDCCELEVLQETNLSYTGSIESIAFYVAYIKLIVWQRITLAHIGTLKSDNFTISIVIHIYLCNVVVYYISLAVTYKQRINRCHLRQSEGIAWWTWITIFIKIIAIIVGVIELSANLQPRL